MKCGICGQGVENSDALEAHNQLVHPVGVGDKPGDALETPDLLGATPEQSAAAETPQPTH